MFGFLSRPVVSFSGNGQLAIKSAEGPGFEKLLTVPARWFDAIFIEYGLRQQYS